MMEELINWIAVNKEPFRMIWFSLGFVGLGIFYHTRKDFYTNRNILWWIAVVVYYSMMGGLIFVLSLITIFVKQRHIIKIFGKKPPTLIGKEKFLIRVNGKIME